ncbi:MAG: gamma-glutamyl-gamma-aminobutyrate hydrolase family protein [Actinobacteria bacterium]|nr:gamma-glutamyl-gamma-aminobutyrate hydrolase family protein [Actinomycetota bacterium]
MQPVIGLTSYRQRGQTGVWDTEMAMLPAFYLEGVSRAGGLAVVLPPQQLDAAGARTLLAGLDGLVITGGRDVESSRYGHEPHEQAEKPDRLRDLLEDELISAAIQMKLPFLGICRGAQMLNVNRGGTLIQHLPDLVGDNRYQPGGGNFAHMNMSIRSGSKLHEIFGDVAENAALYHHQAIDEPGEGLRVVAYSPDGIVQGVEVENHPFGLAVQWHPEQTLDDLRLFQALIKAASSQN